MLKGILTKTDVLLWTAGTTFVAVLGLQLHLFVNYDAALREVVWLRALFATIVITVPISGFMMTQVRKNNLLTAKLRRLLQRDRLTDVATRDYFFSQMQKDPTATGISLMVDIDHFKSVNDTYGHLAGDEAIRNVARVLDQNTRATDIVCRFGGEEFLIFLRGYGRQAAHDVAERIRRTVSEEVIAFDQHQLRVTVSIGGAVKDGPMGIEKAIKLADAALYEAKAAGRNATIFAPDPERAVA